MFKNAMYRTVKWYWMELDFIYDNVYNSHDVYAYKLIIIIIIIIIITLGNYTSKGIKKTKFFKIETNNNERCWKEERT